MPPKKLPRKLQRKLLSNVLLNFVQTLLLGDNRWKTQNTMLEFLLTILKGLSVAAANPCKMDTVPIDSLSLLQGN